MTRIVTDAEAATQRLAGCNWDVDLPLGIGAETDASLVIGALLDTREGDIKAMESDLDACCGPLQDPAYWSPCTFHGAIAERLSQLRGGIVTGETGENG